MAGPLKGGLGTASAIDPSIGRHRGGAGGGEPGRLGDDARQRAPCGPGTWSRRASSAGRCRRPMPPASSRPSAGSAEHHHRRGGDRRRARPGPLQRLAVMAQDGYAYAIRPIHTPFDGDVGVRADHRRGAAAADRGHAGAAGRDRRRRRGTRGLPGCVRGRGPGDYRSYRSLHGPAAPATSMVG